ncbi:cation transporter [Magnetospirillum fulvum]|uniref:Co/Zn/Cd efflux system component n=1 Tax=Magnetospirillum fulvum TaxID=1082 RepID=A0A1H6HPF8_MAGFU|nr:cation transporter [Magnetospirillum fulvum]SEH35893.1 Co/Zn/Cd efflux system component [Magnetospirillum fulvum]
MAGCCTTCHTPVDRRIAPRLRKALWVALAINAAMFLVEIGAGVAAGSAALLADALDFFGDAANYGVSLFVLGLSLRRRAQASLLKGATMGAFGLWVIGNTVHQLLTGTVPAAEVMGAVGLAALVANVAVAAMLYAFRDGDSNMRSVWICSRNDAIGNLAVLGAASGVFATGTGWPDILVAAIMAGLALSGAAQIIRHARAELRLAPRPAPAQ